jgi:hypothetical protein
VSAGIPVAQVVAAVLPAASSASGVSTAVAEVTMGSTAPGASATQVTESVIAVSTQAQFSSADVGAGLGAAAAQLSSSNSSASTEIAAVVSNEGSTGMGSSFASSVVQNGGSQQLADAGNQTPTAGTQTGTPSDNGASNDSGNTNNDVPTCTNPSCT